MANEKRLIDVNSLLLKIEEELSHESPFFTTEQNELIDIGLRIAAGDIRHHPTVDAVEVVHGRWVKYNFFGHEQFACSECQTLGSPQWKRCPVCEAKMDGGNEDA